MTQSGIYTYIQMERVVFGEPCAATLAQEAERIGAERVFLMVSRTLDHNTGVITGVRDALGKRFAGLHEGMPPHTPRDAVLAAAAAAREVKADLIVTLGGGSVVDGAKIVQICLRHDIREIEQLEDYRVVTQADGTRHAPRYEGPHVRQVTVPTTLSGGEFNSAAGCTDPRIRVKQSYRHPGIVPRVVILDPAVTVHTPQWLWLSTGIRALDHATETLCSSMSNPYSDGEAIQALKLLAENLPRTQADPNDLAARLNCQIAVWLSMAHNMAGVPMGASHGIGHVLGGSCNVPHGHTSCVMLPSVLRYNKGHNAERQMLVAQAMGRPGEDAAEVVGEFISSLGQPRTLAEVGVTPDQFERVAQHSMHDRYIHTNPRPIAGPQDVMEILRMAG